MSTGTGTIDVTDLAEQMRQSFVTWGVAFVFGEELAIPALAPILAFPLAAAIDREAIKFILDLISKAEIQQAFFLNTAIRKASQAEDYLSAKRALEALPESTSDDEYKKAERFSNAQFRNLVLLTN